MSGRIQSFIYGTIRYNSRRIIPPQLDFSNISKKFISNFLDTLLHRILPPIIFYSILMIIL
jgi:hypothetical protein